ncbi:MAG: MerR family transcriptional regulator [Candidatus Staskawiczbacteria bacterium]|jgi:DNA-binding transcriptional MerR regulator
MNEIKSKNLNRIYDRVEKDKYGNDIFIEMKERVFQASDARKVTQISYKKLNDWDSKGILPYKFKNEFGWKYFDGYDIICLKILCLLRDKGATLPELKKSYTHLKSNLFIKKAIKDSLKLDLFIGTDLENGFVAIPEKEMDKFVNSINDQPYLIFRFNPIVQDFLRQLKIKL